MDHPDIERTLTYGYPTGFSSGYLNREALRQKKAQEDMKKYREKMKEEQKNGNS